MKTLKLKFLIPVMAICLALTTSAFTSLNDASLNEDAPIMTGYVVGNPGQPCNSVQVDCSVEGELLCTQNNKQVFKNSNGTTCSIQLKRSNP